VERLAGRDAGCWILDSGCSMLDIGLIFWVYVKNLGIFVFAGFFLSVLL
jgi:hypothetical protein